MARQTVFSESVEIEGGLFATASACRDGVCRISAGIGNLAGEKETDLIHARKKNRFGTVPLEVLRHLRSVLSLISSYFEGETKPLYKWKGENFRDSEGAPLVFPQVSDFRLKIWKETAKIPYGKTLTYSELAFKTGGENRRRAVAGALSANPFPILIPCHRVVAAKGTGGYGCGGVEMKKRLLAMESGVED